MWEATKNLPTSVKPWIRLIILAIGLVALCSLSLWMTGTLFPADNRQANIFQSGLLLVILGSLFLEDKFTRPADTVVNALTGIISLITVWTAQVGISWWLVFFYCAAVFLTGITCITLGVPGQVFGLRARISRRLYAVSTTFGSSRVLFTVVFLHAVFAFYGLQSWQTATLVAFWGIYVAIWPLKIPHLLQALLDGSGVPDRCGSILRMETPNIVRIELLPNVEWNSDECIVACTGDGQQRTVLPLFTQLQNETSVGTGLCLGTCQFPVRYARRGQVYTFRGTSQDRNKAICAHFGLDSPALPIGLVFEGSRIGKINFETWCPQECKEGLLVFCQINGKRVFYQVTEGNTCEEILVKNRHGFQVAEAAQLGTIKDGKQFVKYPWLPAANTAVFAAGEQQNVPESALGPGEFLIGTIPGSSMGVVANIEEMLSYHTAILGATGTGKTELAYDLIRKAMSAGTKVFCVDLTGLYGDRLSDLQPQELGISEGIAGELGKKLLDVETGAYGAKEEKKALHKFEIPLRKDIGERVNSFLDSDEHFIGLFNLPTISNTRTTILVTEMYLSSIFRYAREHPKGNPILVVLEEAHTVVPESSTMGLGDSGSKAMVAKIAQIALQGRKYNVGLLVIAQRTATVSKTVLTQCITVISFSCFDQTSINFLTNVFGKDHAGLVPNLGFLQAVMFGKGIMSERPLIVEIPFDEHKQQGAELQTENDQQMEVDQGNDRTEEEPHFSEEELTSMEEPPS